MTVSAELYGTRRRARPATNERNGARMETQLPNRGIRVFRRWSNNAQFEETRLGTGEATVHIRSGSKQVFVAVAGRVSVDSSPDLLSAFLELLRRSAAPVMLLDMSNVTYLDMSGLAILLEALKAARERSVKLRITGIGGEARNLVEIAQLDTIFRTWGSEVELQ